MDLSLATELSQLPAPHLRAPAWQPITPLRIETAERAPDGPRWSNAAERAAYRGIYLANDPNAYAELSLALARLTMRIVGLIFFMSLCMMFLY